MNDQVTITTGNPQTTQDSTSGEKKGKTMRNLYRYLAVAVLSIGMAACQTDAVRADAPLQPPASLLDIRPPDVIGNDELQAANATGLAPQQYGCAWQGQDDYYGYTACLEHNTGFWWLIWLHGHGFDSCFFTIWSNGGHWTPFQQTYDWEICN